MLAVAPIFSRRLAPLMRQGARLVMLSSNGHRFSDIDLDDLNFEHSPYDPWLAYGRSKTGDALLAVAFDARATAGAACTRQACIRAPS